MFGAGEGAVLTQQERNGLRNPFFYHVDFILFPAVILQTNAAPLTPDLFPVHEARIG